MFPSPAAAYRGLEWKASQRLNPWFSFSMMADRAGSCSCSPLRPMSCSDFSWLLNASSPSCNVGESRLSNQRSGVAMVTAGRGNSNTSEEAALDASWACQPHDQATCEGPSWLAPGQSLTARFLVHSSGKEALCSCGGTASQRPRYLSSRSTARSHDSLGPP